MIRRRQPTGEQFAKLQRLGRFRYSLPHASQTALAAFCDAAAKGELPELTTRRHQYQARDAQMNADTFYGKVEQVVELHPQPPYSSAQLRVVSPQAFLSVAFANGGGFREFLLNRHAQTPSSPERPWGLVLYGDEMDPGMALASTHNRKAWMFYYSFVEYGPLALSNEEMWYTISVKRATDMARIQDGCSQVVACLLKHIFCGIHDPRTVGIDFHDSRDGSVHTIYVTLKGLLLDGAAHKVVWGIFGASGFRMCALCLNLWALKSRIAEEDGSEGLVCSITEPTRLIFATNEDIFGTVDRLQRRRLTDDAHTFEVRERTVGYHHLEYGVLLDPALRDMVRPVDMHIHDPQHTLFVDGVVNAVIYLSCEAIHSDSSQGPHSRLKEFYAVTYAYLSAWRWPRKIGSNVCELFNATRVASWRTARHVKAPASDLISIYNVLQYFLATCSVLRDGRCHLQLEAYRLMCHMVDGIMLVPFGKISQAEVTARIYAFIRACVAAGWEESMKPKFHWLVHLTGHLSCFTLERKHKSAKKYASDKKNTTAYEQSVLGDCTCEHLASLERDDFGRCEVGLVAPRQASKQAIAYLRQELDMLDDPEPNASFQTGLETRFGMHGTCQRGDVVLLRNDDDSWGCGEVWLNASVCGVPMSIISVWEFVSFDREGGFAKWKQQDNAELWDTSMIAAVCIHRRYADVCVTLLPAYVR